MKWHELTIKDERELLFGRAPHPVRSGRGLVFGGGVVYPELNFTVPEGTVINRSTLSDLGDRYAKAVDEAIRRSIDLHAEGLVIEFETLLEMTVDPDIGVELTKRMNDVCEHYYQKHGFPSEIRLTPNDTRDFDRPPQMRSGKYLEGMFELFDQGAAVGGNILSIESTGGKEVCDEALTMCEIRQVIFALAVLGVRDMQFIWPKIVAIAKKHGRIAGGDTACGFANTAMVLAEKKYIPGVFAAAVRIASSVRSLVAIEAGATGPDKDCGYEGVYLKAIAGIPISMEGKTAACAHLSPVGNVASACADLWSNESVQNLKLLGGMAPTVYTEQLIYDARLMNRATAKGHDAALQLRDLMVESDVHYDPQALVLSPRAVVEIAGVMVGCDSYLDAACKGVLKGMAIIDSAVASGELLLPEMDRYWLGKIKDDVASIPADEGTFIDEIVPTLDPAKVDLKEYGL